MAAAYTFAQALQDARATTRRASRLVDAVENGRLAGPGVVPFRFSSDSHAGFAGTQLASIKDGALVVAASP